MLERRSILKGLVGLVAAPAIIKVAGIMSVKASLQPSRHDGISVRSIVKYAPGADQAIDRFDILFGSYLPRPEWVLEADGTGTLPCGTRERLHLPDSWKNSPGFAQRVASEFNEQFPDGAKVGDQLRVRIPDNYVVTDGMALSFQDTSEREAYIILSDANRIISQPPSAVPDQIALAAAAIAIAPAILKTPVTRRFWAAP